MTRSFLTLHHLSFQYNSSIHPIIHDLSCQFEQGWTGIVGPNGCGKTTLLKLLTRELKPTSGTVELPGHVIYCEQRTYSKPADLSNFMDDYSKSAFRIRSQLKIEETWTDRWPTLSHGERKRLQLALVLHQSPDILAVDEPTNHIDHVTRKTLLDALKSYRGIGLIVSHDREFLDALCTHTLFMQDGNILFRKGSYSTVHTDLAHESAFKEHQALSVKRKMRRLQREVHQRAQKAAQADSKRSKKHIHRKDHDAKAKMDLARLSGKDAVEGKIKKRLDSQMNRLEQTKQSIGWKKPSPKGIRIENTTCSNKLLFHIPSAEIPMGKRILRVPDLFVYSGDRIGLIGSNGFGKSTLISYMIDNLPLGQDDTIYIPQEIDESTTHHLINDIQILPKDQLAKLMTIISRLDSDPQRVLETDLPSPGETRKLMLARGIQKSPQLIVMDEPTNHMDLPSIELVEQALDACNCALILVSHDYRFLENLHVDFWEIEKIDNTTNRVTYTN